MLVPANTCKELRELIATLIDSIPNDDRPVEFSAAHSFDDGSRVEARFKMDDGNTWHIVMDMELEY